MGIWGQDWSSYQAARPSTAGLSFAFTKITEGLTYVNPEWVSQRDTAKTAGLVWGGYHYPHMANSVQAEADAFLNQVAWKPGDMACLDWEGYDSANAGVPDSEKRAYKDAWLRYVKARLPHNPVGLYCNTDYWLNIDTTSYYGDFLWIATSGRAAGDPGIRAPWLFHQYNNKPVDSDYCHLASTAALRAWTLSFLPAPSTSPTKGTTDVAITDDDANKIAMAVLTYKNADSLKADPDLPDVYGYIAGGYNAVAALTAQVGALSNAVAALAKDGGVSAEQVQAAALAGAKAALTELGQAASSVK